MILLLLKLTHWYSLIHPNAALHLGPIKLGVEAPAQLAQASALLQWRNADEFY